MFCHSWVCKASQGLDLPLPSLVVQQLLHHRSAEKQLRGGPSKEIIQGVHRYTCPIGSLDDLQSRSLQSLTHFFSQSFKINII